MNGKSTECFSFPESQILLLYFSEELTQLVEHTFEIKGCINPSYVISLGSSMYI